MYEPRISVIMTSFNYEKFIAEAIDSALSQDYANKEIIVVDDASSDASPQIISAYGDTIIPVLKTKNGGHGAAFNAGFEASSGDIIALLDVDDFLYPGALTHLANSVVDGASMYQFRMNLVNETGEVFDVYPKMETPFLVGDQKQAVLEFGRIKTTVTSGLAFSRAFMEQVMPMPPERYRQGGDGYLATMAPLYGTLVDGGQTRTAAYRQHGSNHSSFGAMIEKRAKWCLEHDAARYDSLRHHADLLNLSVTEPLGYQDEDHLAQAMAMKLRDPTFAPDTSRSQISAAAIATLKDTPMSQANRIAITSWWKSLALLPTAQARKVHAWRLYASTRPAWLKRLARFLRRI